MRNTPSTPIAAALIASLSLYSCGGDNASGAASGTPQDSDPGASGVTAGGSQDFGLFRQILEDGETPGPGTLDEVGFFAEHKLDYPAPDCEKDLCMHGLFGTMGNMISGANCTLIQIGMNTPIDPAELERPPMHLVIAVDVSGSMLGEPIQYLRSGLVAMVDELEPEDTISLVEYSSDARVILDAVPATETEALVTAFQSLDAGGGTNLYEGLFTAFQLAANHLDETAQNRVIFLSDGMATAGLQEPAKLTSLARAYARQGIALTSVGVGTQFDVDVMRGLGEVGAGNFYFLEDPAAVHEVFSDEVQTFLFPIALDVRINASIARAYMLRASYGTTGWESYKNGGYVEIPALFVAGRQSADEPIEEGRRGGGGAILLELIPRLDGPVEDPYQAGYLSIEWREPVTGAPVSQSIEITAPHEPGQEPEAGFFSHKTVEKGFVMLNLFAGFEMAIDLASDSDPRTAQATLIALRGSVEAWLAENPDPDIQDDLRYVDLFITNLESAIRNTPPYEPADPPDPWPRD